ncbi:restriction endonuclease subunit S, partial [Glutamicibacter sp. AOP5-B1-3]
RKQQYEHYLKLLLAQEDGEVTWMSLGDIGRVAMCKRIFKSETTPTGEIPFFKIGTFGGQPNAFISRERYDDYRARYSFPNKGDVLISAAGTIGRVISYSGEAAYFQDSNIVWLEHDESLVTNDYLRYWYRVVKWSTDGDMIKRLYNENIRRARIAVPSLEEQRRIVEILDKFDELVNDLSVGLPAELSARRQQYEYYRDKLLTFKELEPAS